MPRTFSRPSQLYAAGTYGPFAIDGFTKNNAEYVEGIFTVENWPALFDPAVTVQGEWSNGQPFGASFPGAPVARNGTPATQVSFRAAVPRQAGTDGAPTKRDVVSGTITVTLHAALRTAITFRAV